MYPARAGTTTIPTKRRDIAEIEPIFHGGLHRFLYEVTSPLILSCNGELQRYAGGIGPWTVRVYSLALQRKSRIFIFHLKYTEIAAHSIASDIEMQRLRLQCEEDTAALNTSISLRRQATALRLTGSEVMDSPWLKKVSGSN